MKSKHKGGDPLVVLLVASVATAMILGNAKVLLLPLIVVAIKIVSNTLSAEIKEDK